MKLRRVAKGKGGNPTFVKVGMEGEGGGRGVYAELYRCQGGYMVTYIIQTHNFNSSIFVGFLKKNKKMCLRNVMIHYTTHTSNIS